MPIDIGSGSVHQLVEDFRIDGRFPLIWERKYHSALINDSDSPFGPGWSSPFFAALTRIGKDYRFRSRTGAEIVFQDPDDSVEHGATLRDLGSFHEIRKSGAHLRVSHWTVSGSLSHCVFFPGRNGDWWPLRSQENACGKGLDLAWDESGTLKGIRQKHEKRTIVFAYSSAGRMSSVHFRHPDGRQTILAGYEYDSSGRLASASDALNAKVRYEYDKDGRLFREIAKDGGVFTYKYDEKGRCVKYGGLDNYDLKIVRYLDHIGWTEVTNSLGSVRRYVRLPNGQISQEIDPLGGQTLSEYDEFGRLISTTNPSGAKTSFEYDGFGNQSKVIDALGGAIAFEYNQHHLVTCEIDPGGGRWEREYDESFRAISSTDPLGNRYEVRYDPNGNPIEISRPNGAVSKRIFSETGELAASSDWVGRKTHYSKDDFGRTIERRDPDGTIIKFQYDPVGRMISASNNRGEKAQSVFDIAGNLLSSRDANGISLRFKYGLCRRLLEKTDETGQSVRYAWGSEPDRLESIMNEKGERYLFKYDPCERLIKEIGYDGRETSYKYDLSGQCIRRTNGMGQSISWMFDPLGRMFQETPDGDGPTVYQYDESGKLASAENAWGRNSYARDKLGRVLEEAQGGFAIRRTYGAIDECLRLETDAGIAFENTYDGNGSISAIDAGGAGLFEFKRNDRNQISESILPRGLRLNQEFDHRGRLVGQVASSIGSPGSVSRKLVVRKFEYNESNLLKRISDGLWGDVEYDYDGAERLTGFKSEGSRFDLQLDAIGDPIVQRLGDTRLVESKYGPGGALLEKGWTSYAYDGAGRLIRKVDRSESKSPRTWEFQWDAKDQLRKLHTPEGETWEYQYDPFGRRIRKTGPNRDTRFYWDGFTLLHQIEANGEIQTWGFEPNGFKPIFKMEGKALYSIVCDHIGTPREMIDADGNVAWSASFDPWGNPIASKGKLEDCPIRFQGQYFDSESGLHYNNFRYYDPKDGRFISPDPIRLQGGTALYQYAQNPVHWIDPLGLCKTKGGAEEESADPMSIHFTQPTANQNFSSGHTINETIQALKSGKLKPSDLPTIRVVERDGKLYSLDNRRLVAFQNAGITEIPIQRVSLSDPAVAKEFNKKFNPVNDGRNIVITENADGRKPAERVLREHGKIR